MHLFALHSIYRDWFVVHIIQTIDSIKHLDGILLTL